MILVVQKFSGTKLNLWAFEILVSSDFNLSWPSPRDVEQMVDK